MMSISQTSFVRLLCPAAVLVILALCPFTAAASGGWTDCDTTCLVTSYVVEDDTVACLDDLANYTCASLTLVDTCTLEQTLAFHVIGSGADTVTTCNATTAMGVGPDGAVRLLGLSMTGLTTSDMFVETEVGLTLTQYANDIAILRGEVANEDDPDQRFEVFVVYENRTDGSDWAGGFKYAMGCNPPTDTWDIYTIKADQSHLLGKGAFEGSLLQLQHAPSSQFFGFQIGLGANDHNCNYGAGGWMSWSGNLCGTDVNGSLGDIIVDLECGSDFDPCTAQSVAYFNAYVEDCGVIQYTKNILRIDEEGPVISGLPNDTVVECIPEFNDPGGVTATDNCPAPGFPTLTYLGGFEVEASEGHCKTFEERWEAEDECGNVTQAHRLVHVFDNTPPAMVGDEIVIIECDEWPGGFEPPFQDLVDAGIIDVTDNCAIDTVLIDFGVMSGGCHYDHIMTYTPVDECGNVGASLYQIVVVDDTTPPTLVDVPADTLISCTTPPEAVDELPSAIDNCDPAVNVTFEVNYLDDGDGCDETYIIERIFIAQDCSYNHARDTQLVHVADTAGPALTLNVPGDTALYGCFGDVDVTSTVLGDATFTVSDDCGDYVYTLDVADSEVEFICTCTYEADTAVFNPCSLAPGDYRTQTQGGWGQDECSGDNPACYRDANFDSAFPGGITVGCASGSLTFTSSAAVAAFLPCGGPPSIAVGNQTDPACDQNVFAAQLLTAKLTLGFDQADASFSSSPLGIELLSPDSGPLQAFTIQDIVDAADLVLGGCGDAALEDQGFTIPNLVEALTNFNESFIDGTAASGSMRIADCTAYVTTYGKVCTGPEVGSGVFERTWTLTATDCAGNTSILEASQAVTVTDTTAPVLEIEPLVSLDCADWNDGFSAEEALDLGFLTVSDDCGIDTVVVELLGEGSSGCAGAVEVRYAATDWCDNVSEGTQVILLVDTVAPVFTTIPADEDLPCDGDPQPYQEGDAVAVDACSAVTITTHDELVIADCPSSAVWERTITAEDECGNEASIVQRFHRVDDVDPVISAHPADTAVHCLLPAFVDGTVTYSDDCDEAPEFSVTDDTVFYDCPGTFTVERHFTVTDCSGNVAEEVQIIEVTDTEDPVLTIAGPSLTVSCSEWVCDIDFLIGLGQVSATDNCGEVDLSVECLDFSGGCLDPNGMLTLMYTAVDPCGNSVQAEQVLLLYDSIAPVGSITCPDDVTLPLNPDCTYDLGAPGAALPWGAPTGSAEDLCDDDLDLEFSYSDAEPVFDCGDAGGMTIARTHTLVSTDRCGNADTVSCVQHITLEDVTGPVITLDPPMPHNIFGCITTTDTSLAALGVLTATAEDACGGEVTVDITYSDAVTVTCSGDDGLPEGTATLDRTFTVTATDCGGNSTVATHVQTVNFFDTEAPTVDVTCPADTAISALVDCSANSAPTFLGIPFVDAQDNCDSDVAYTVTYSDEETPGECIGARTVVRTFTIAATDDCGNGASASCQQTITITDDTPPSIVLACPADAEIALDADCSWDGNSGAPSTTITDGCDPDPSTSITHADHDTTYLCAGDDALLEGSFSFIRTFTVSSTDDCGNTTVATCDQLVTLLDVTAPADHDLATLPTDTLYLDADCEADLTPASAPTTGAVDGCDSDVALEVSHTDDAAVYEALSDGVELQIDTVAMDGAPGATTYRLYAVLNNPGDCLSAVVGEGAEATWITSTAPFYQHPLGAATPSNIDPILYDMFPELEFDSWVTIGIDQVADPAANQSAIQVVESTPWVAQFEAGESIGLNSAFGDGWFALPTSANGTPGPDGRVLIAQLTTSGHVSGQLYLQVLEDGPGGADQRYTLSFGNACTAEDGNQEGSYTFVRTWQSVATDDCGNADTVYTFQNIAVLDTTAPQLTETCGLMNGEEVQLDCAGPWIFDLDPLPLPCLVEAVDNCDSDVGVARFDEIDDDAPTDGTCNICAPSDPAPFAGGLTCDNAEPEAMRLFNFNGQASSSFVLEPTAASRFNVQCDSALQVELVLTDGNGGGFTFTADYGFGGDWDAWSDPSNPYHAGLAGSYKKDCPEVYPGIPVWLDWHYFYMLGGTLEGSGTYAGTSLSLVHQPVNGFYGFQVGPGANNKNEEYGAGGWFLWDGNVVVDGVDQGQLASSGDIFVDLDCCLPWEASHHYVASDDCGNTTPFHYTVTNSGQVAVDGAGLSGGPVHTGGPIVIGDGGLTGKVPFRVLGLNPNPTADMTQLQFEVDVTQRMIIRLHTMSGEHVLDVFDGLAEPGAAYQIEIGVTALSAGLYQLRLSSSVHSEVRKLLIAD